MRKYMIASILCGNGIVGGGLLAEDEMVTYLTNKLTVNPKYRHLEMHYGDITHYTTGWFLCFPTVTLHFKDGTTYKFLVFNRNKFTTILDEKLCANY